MRPPAALAALLLLPLVAFTALASGCDRITDRAYAHMSAHAFDVGSPDRYRKPGVYDRFKRSHGVWLWSDGRFVAALAAECPYDAGDTSYDPLPNQYKCERCGARFGGEGLPRGKSGKAAEGRRSLERLRIELRPSDDRPADGGESALQVNPAQRFSQETGGWSYRYSLYEFAGGAEPAR